MQRYKFSVSLLHSSEYVNKARENKQKEVEISVPALNILLNHLSFGVLFISPEKVFEIAAWNEIGQRYNRTLSKVVLYE